MMKACFPWVVHLELKHREQLSFFEMVDPGTNDYFFESDLLHIIYSVFSIFFTIVKEISFDIESTKERRKCQDHIASINNYFS